MNASLGRFSISLRSLFALTALCGVAVHQGLRYVELNRPLELKRPFEWQPYSRAAVQQEVAAGRNVLVLVSARWDFSSVVQPEMLDTPEVKELARSRNITFLSADATDPQAEILQQLQSLGYRRYVPQVLFFSAQGGAPTPLVADGYLTADEFIKRFR